MTDEGSGKSVPGFPDAGKKDSKANKPNFIFHVVSSVKGGCGKSTFALFLADYWSSKGENVYLLDLDTSGTSWKDDYESCIFNSNGEIYLNDIVKRSKIYNFTDIWWHLKSNMYTNGNENISNVNLCISDPSNRKEISEYQIDLFEQAVIGLVEDEIISKNSNPIKTTHIIFDMPPGVEKKAERIFKNWLLSQNIAKSKLHAVNLLKDSSCDKTNTFAVKLYMMSTLSTSSIISNWEYIKNLFVPLNYYNNVDYLINKKCLSVHMIINDLTNIKNSDPKTHLLNNELMGLHLSEIDQRIIQAVDISAALIPHYVNIPSRFLHTKRLGIASSNKSLTVDALSTQSDCEHANKNSSSEWKQADSKSLSDIISLVM